MNTLNKKNTKTANLLNVQYKALHKLFGPFLDLFVNVKNQFDTVGDVMSKFTEKTEEAGEAIETASKPLNGFLKGLRMISSTMILILGVFAAVGAAMYLLASQAGEGSANFEVLGGVIEGVQRILSALGDGFAALMAGVGAVDFAAIGAVVMPILQGVFDFLGSILIVFLNVVAMVIESIGKIVAAMNEAGMFERISGAIAMVLGAAMVGFGIVEDAIKSTGLTVEGVLDAIQGAFDYVIGWLFSSGLMEFFVKVIEIMGVVYSVIIVIAAQVIALYVRIWSVIGPPLVRFVKAVFDFLNPIVRIITGIIGLIIDAIVSFVSFLLPYFSSASDMVMTFLSPILDIISGILDGASAILDFGGSLLGGAADFLGFSEGGIASGPTSGYPAVLHGTEAVVPLPDGRTIPVSLKGDIGGGGSQTNITINVSGGGNAKDIAKAVSDEVSKVMRTRSRGNGYTRGVI